MITDSDRAKYALPEKPNRKPTLIDRADEQVDIRDIMKQMGMWAPPGSFSSWKIYCPFHAEHADQMDKNCRVYGTNNIYCFAMHGRITSTSLYARWKGIPRIAAATILLKERGLLYKPWRTWWNELIMLREDKQHNTLGSQTDAISALRTYLERVDGYEEQEFETEVRIAWQEVLEELDNMWKDPASSFEKLNAWLTASLTRILESARIGK